MGSERRPSLIATWKGPRVSKTLNRPLKVTDKTDKTDERPFGRNGFPGTRQIRQQNRQKVFDCSFPLKLPVCVLRGHPSGKKEPVGVGRSRSQGPHGKRLGPPWANGRGRVVPGYHLAGFRGSGGVSARLGATLGAEHGPVKDDREVKR